MIRRSHYYGRRDILRALGAMALLGRMARGDEPEKSVPEQLIDALDALFGKHPGFRAAHAKGIVCEGEFTPSPTAATISRAPHLQGAPVRATVRFSDSTGIPNIPDGAPDASPHGMAVRFHLPTGSTDIVANAFNGFAVATPEEFVAFLRAIAESGPKAPKPTALDKFLSTHPRTLKVVTTPKPTPASFVTETYYGVNAFLFTNKEGKSRYGRYQLQPDAGEHVLTKDEAAKQPATFLIDELGKRLAKAPASFRLIVQLAAEGDPTDDATAVWPDNRPKVQLGTLSIARLAPDNDAAQHTLAFDPLHLIDGIEPSDDPLLEARSAAYAISRRRRKQK